MISIFRFSILILMIPWILFIPSCKKVIPATTQVLTTTGVHSITETTATSGGSITGDGKSAITARGICWGTTSSPTISGNKTNDGSGNGTFVSNLEGLQPGTTYYIRSYGTSNEGSSYGNEKNFTTHSIVTSSKIKVYPALPANRYMSDRYEVSVGSNNEFQSSYVYKDPNNDLRWTTLWPSRGVYLTKENHFTTFSFTGEMTVNINLPLRTTISTVVVRPLSKNLSATISGNTISVSLSAPANFYVEIDGEEKYPLFIFANPLELIVPDPNDPNVIYFGPGIHEIGISGGPMQNIPAGKTVYLAGGAYVKGVLKTNGATGTTAFSGRGILSGIDITGLSAYYPIIGAGGGTVRVEGIIINDAPQGYQGIIAYGTGCVLENVKMISWAMESDAGSLGPNSLIKNCFYKLNDDVLKATQPGMLFKDNIVWQQMNGQVIMLGWNSITQSINATVSGLDVIGCDVAQITSPTAQVMGIVKLANSNGATYKNMTFENIRIEKGPYMLIGISIKQTDPGWTDNVNYNKGLGSLDGIQFRNISMPTIPVRKSYFNGNGYVTTSSTGDIKNISFENITFGGIRLTEQNTANYIITTGNTSNFIYK